MNYPSVKTIAERLAEPLRKQGRFTLKQAAELIRVYMKTGDAHDQVDAALSDLNKILGGYGVESITDNQWDDFYANCGVLYVNMGDAYTPTVCFDTRAARWMICSWGDLVEGNPKRFADR